MPSPDAPQVLHGPYNPPRIQIGDRIHCLLRDCVCVVTNWSAGRISWPRVRSLNSRGGSGILLEEELARAVRSESALALGYWWGVSEGVVWRWRKVLGISRAGTEGSRRLIQAAAEKGAEANREREFSEAERKVRRRNARRLNLVRHLKTGYHGSRWTPEQLALLGTIPDADVAQIADRSVNAVRVMRTRWVIATVEDERRGK